MRHFHIGFVGLGSLICFLGLTNLAGAQYPYPYVPSANPYNPYWYNPYYGRGGVMRGTADVISAQGEVLTKQEEARILREKANQAKIQTKRKAFDEMMYEKANTPSFSEEQEKIKGLLIRRIMNDPAQAEINSGKAQNILLPYLQGLTNQGIQGPPLSLDPTMLQQINVTVGEQGNIGILKDGGRLDWPLALRGKEQKKLDSLLPQAVSAATMGTLEPKLYGKVKTGVGDLQQELSRRFRKEEIDGGMYLDGKRFMDSLDSAVQMLAKPQAAKLLSGTYAARGRNVQELVNNMTRQGLQFAAAIPGGENAYQSLYNSMVAYAHGAQTSTGFQARYSPAGPKGQ